MNKKVSKIITVMTERRCSS